jgi:hypothetical protein
MKMSAGGRNSSLMILIFSLYLTFSTNSDDFLLIFSLGLFDSLSPAWRMGEDRRINLEEREVLELSVVQRVREMSPALGSDNEYPHEEGGHHQRGGT